MTVVDPSVPGGAGHGVGIDTATRGARRRVLMVVPSTAVGSNDGRSVGLWAAEFIHPYDELTERGLEVDIASPGGGKVEFDALCVPRDASRWSSAEWIRMGFVHGSPLPALLADVPKLADLDHARYHALLVCAAQAPMFTGRDHADLCEIIRTFYEAGKVTAALRQGVAALVDVRLSDGTYLVTGKTVTGLADIVRDANDRRAGPGVLPWRFEDALRDRGANCIKSGPLTAVAVRDGRLEGVPFSRAGIRPQGRGA